MLLVKMNCSSSSKLLVLGGLRTFGTSTPFHAVEKSALAKLRKATGYSFARCKEALEKYENDIGTAEKWLRSEAQSHGWEKATKLQGRATGQGLVSVLATPQHAVMLEVNCETDFVARNKKFQTLVQKVTQACFSKCEQDKRDVGSGEHVFKNPLDATELGNVPLQDHLTKDEVALSIGDIGENIQTRRALLLQATEPVLLAGYTHPASLEAERHKIVQFGKFGAIVAYKCKLGAGGKVGEIGRQLCQHIVGMNPTEIGSLDAPPPKKKAAAPPPPPPPRGPDDDPVDELDMLPIIERNTEAEDERILLNQEFLLDPELTVREFLVQNSVEVVDFARFECGEILQSH